jgi:hypothetical protein
MKVKIRAAGTIAIANKNPINIRWYGSRAKNKVILIYFSSLFSIDMKKCSNLKLSAITAIIPPVATKKLTRGKITINTKNISTNKKN